MLRKILFASVLMLGAPAAMAATCSVNLEGNDMMKFNVANIDVSKSCKDFTINLKHTGKLARNGLQAGCRPVLVLLQLPGPLLADEGHHYPQALIAWPRGTGRAIINGCPR